jgi:hypothetical protein
VLSQICEADVQRLLLAYAAGVGTVLGGGGLCAQVVLCGSAGISAAKQQDCSHSRG